MINIQENLKENITKVIEKLREEGKKGNNYSPVKYNTYPIQMWITEESQGKLAIKDYREYMKWLQVLESLFGMLRYGDSEAISFDKIEEEVLIIQNTMRESLDNNFTQQYACLVRCYEHLLRMLRMRPVDSKVNVTYTRSE